MQADICVPKADVGPRLCPLSLQCCLREAFLHTCWFLGSFFEQEESCCLVPTSEDRMPRGKPHTYTSHLPAFLLAAGHSCLTKRDACPVSADDSAFLIGVLSQ